MVFTDSISIASFTPFLVFVVQTTCVLLHISETLTRERSVYEHKFISKIWSHGAHLPTTEPCNILFLHLSQSSPYTTRDYRRLSLMALAARPADKRVRKLTLLPNTHSVISVQFLSPISPNVYSVRTWRRLLIFLFFKEHVYLNLLTCLLIVLGLGTGRFGNFTRNLHRVSEHVFLLFIYVLWIYTPSHNENSCLGMSQIAIITITTFTALTFNNNHNQ